jgi:predicted 3-demethylubiquinone-9 3-methyltransferase (glyoxalase superfamily)
MKPLTTCLWFDGRAREAAEFYCSIFPDSGIDKVWDYPEGARGTEGDVMYIEFHLAGRDFALLNGGPQFPHTEAASIVVPCETTEEIDRYYDALVEGGSPQPCGWLKDRFGVSWQVTSVEADGWMQDPERGARVFAVMMEQFGKLDVEALRKAYDA